MSTHQRPHSVSTVSATNQKFDPSQQYGWMEEYKAERSRLPAQLRLYRAALSFVPPGLQHRIMLIVLLPIDGRPGVVALKYRPICSALDAPDRPRRSHRIESQAASNGAGSGGFDSRSLAEIVVKDGVRVPDGGASR